MAAEPTALAFLTAGLIGAGIGFASLLRRYSDEPFVVARSLPAWLYMILNGLASVLALLMMHAFDWQFGIDPGNRAGLWWSRVLVAGFGSAMLFRSTLFSVRVGDQDVGVGPKWLLDSMFSAIDGQIDRARAATRAGRVVSIMKGLSFEKSRLELPIHCFALMQRLPEDEQTTIRSQIELLSEQDISDRAKVLSLGLLLMNAVGEAVLRAAVRSLDDTIRPRRGTS